LVDTAPTGHALRLLALPETALEWVHAFLAVLLKYRRVIGLGELGQELLEASHSLRRLIELLHDPKRARLVVVTRAAELPRFETERLLRQLDKFHIAVGAVVVDA